MDQYEDSLKFWPSECPWMPHLHETKGCWSLPQVHPLAQKGLSAKYTPNFCILPSSLCTGTCAQHRKLEAWCWLWLLSEVVRCHPKMPLEKSRSWLECLRATWIGSILWQSHSGPSFSPKTLLGYQWKSIQLDLCIPTLNFLPLCCTTHGSVWRQTMDGKRLSTSRTTHTHVGQQDHTFDIQENRITEIYTRSIAMTHQYHMSESCTENCKSWHIIFSVKVHVLIRNASWTGDSHTLIITNIKNLLEIFWGLLREVHVLRWFEIYWCLLVPIECSYWDELKWPQKGLISLTKP